MPAKKTKDTVADKTTPEKTTVVKDTTEEKAAPKKAAAKKAAPKKAAPKKAAPKKAAPKKATAKKAAVEETAVKEAAVEEAAVKEAAVEEAAVKETAVEAAADEIAAAAEEQIPDTPRRSIAFIGSECYPFVKTGGLGDVMYSLPKALIHRNCDVKVILPRYKCIPQKYQEKMVYRGSFYMDLTSDGKQYYVGIME